MNKIRLLWFSLSVTCLVWAVVGCSTTQTTAAFKGEEATDLGVRAAMSGWGIYVATQHPGTNSEQQVWNAFQSYKAAQVTLIDATAALANSTNSAPLTAAQAALAATQADLLTLITSLTNSIK